MTMSQARTYYDMLSTKETDVYIARPQHIKVKVEHGTLIYKVFDVANKKKTFVDMRKLKKCLAPVWDKITYYRRGSSYATLEVRFASGEVVKRNSD